MSLSVEAQIRDAANKNQELLTALSETDYAGPALESQQAYVNDIDRELKQLASRIHQLEATRQKELKEHEKYRDSVVKRFAHRVSRRSEQFEAKASKEEREYFDALRDEHQAKSHARSLRENRATATAKITDELEPVRARHTRAQTELDQLYDSIFDGPTPGFPEEDDRENTARVALDAYYDASVRLEAESQALDLLGQARTQMDGTLAALDEARSNSRADMFMGGGGGMIMDMMERDALSRAETMNSRVHMLVDQARRITSSTNSPSQIGPITHATVAHGSLISDVVFDSVFTDHAFHQKIKASQDAMHASAASLSTEWEKCRARVADLQNQLDRAGHRLTDARGELQRVRQQAFERISSPSPLPPSSSPWVSGS